MANVASTNENKSWNFDRRGLKLDGNAPTNLSAMNRIRSIDFIRGAVMVLMAIDHVRVYSGLPAGGPTVGIFFTRWVTHFCAPVFVFLAGTSAFLYAIRVADKNKVSMYLLKRGALLVILELTIIRFFWTFNLRLDEFMLAGVIWMIGWCMIIMAGLSRLKPSTVGVIGLVIISSNRPLRSCRHCCRSPCCHRSASFGNSSTVLDSRVQSPLQSST